MTRERVLLVNVLSVAVCALVYELLCGTLASYLLGDAVLQFTLVLGTYLFAMGAGAWVSKAFEREAGARYVQAELLLAVVGGLSVPALLLAVSAHLPLRPVLHGMVFLVGAIVGLELPLLIAILRRREARGEAAPGASAPPAPAFGEVVARALAYDYIGALAASVLFPLVLVPRLGLVRTAAITGLVNASLALSATWIVRVERPALLRAAGACVLGVLAFAFLRGEAWVAFATD